MANTTVGASVQVEFASIGQMRKAIKEATSDLIVMQEQFGKTSPQAIEAAKKVADLKDRIADAKEQADLFDPGKRFSAFTNAANQIAAGFSAVQGAMALVGTESEDLQKTLVKVQGAVALSQGLSQLKDLSKAYDEIKIVAVDAFKAIKGAIGTTGIGLLVVALGTIVAYWDDIKSAVTGATKETDLFKKSQAEVNKAIADATKKFMEVNVSMDMAKKGTISKKDALEVYNKELGDTLGKTSSFEEAEKRIAENTTRYLKSVELRTRAQIFFGKAAEAAAKAASGEDIEPSIWQTIGNALTSGGNAAVFFSKQTKSVAGNIADLNDESAMLNKLANEQLKGAIELEKQVDAVGKNKTFEDQVKKNNKAIDDAAKKREEDAKKRQDAEKVLEDARLAMLSSRQRAEEEILKQFEERKKTLQAGGIKDFTAIEQQRDNELKALRKQFSDEDLKLAQDFEDQLTKITTDRRLASIKDARVKEVEDLKQGYEEQRKTIDENEKLTFEQRFILLASLKENERLAMQELEAKFAAEDNEKKIAKLEKELEEEGTTFDRKRAILDEEALLFQAQLDSKAISEEQYNEKVKALSDARIAINNEEVNAKLEAAQAISSILGNLSQLAGEQTEEGKALAIAQATIDTFVNAVKAYKSSLDIPIIGPYIAPVNAALAVAAGVAQIQQISAVQVPGGNGGGGASRPSISTGAPAGPAPNPTVVAQTLNTQAINQLGNQSMRAYVLNSDMQNNDQRNAYLQRNARIG